MARRGRALLAWSVLGLASLACTPGASPVISASVAPPTTVSPPSSGPRWSGTIVSRSEHRLYVGGTCTSDWRTGLRFAVQGTNVRGTGAATLTSHGSPCPFPVAQLQIRRFALTVSGTLEDGRLMLRLREDGHVPSAGADDLGGFRATALGTELHLRVRHREVSTTVTLRAPDQDRGEFSSSNAVRLRCSSC